jgi:hypothetical protein
VILIVGLVGTWGTSSLSQHRAAATQINPLELMQNATTLPVEHYEAH